MESLPVRLREVAHGALIDAIADFMQLIEARTRARSEVETDGSSIEWVGPAFDHARCFEQIELASEGDGPHFDDFSELTLAAAFHAPQVSDGAHVRLCHTVLESAGRKLRPNEPRDVMDEIAETGSGLHDSTLHL